MLYDGFENANLAGLMFAASNPIAEDVMDPANANSLGENKFSEKEQFTRKTDIRKNCFNSYFRYLIQMSNSWIF